MKHVLVKLMSEMTQLTSDEALAIENSFPLRSYPKGTYLLQEGKVAKDSYFVVKGCIRSYELYNGEERTLGFYTENQSAANFNSLANGTASLINFICTEETTVALFNSEKEKEFYDKFSRFERFCREGME